MIAAVLARAHRGCVSSSRAWLAPGCSASATSPTPRSASSRSCGRRRARSPRAASSRSTARPATRPRLLRGGVHFVLLPVAVPHPPRAARRRSRKARSATSTRATASRSPPVQTLGRVVRVQQLPGRPRVPRGRRAARPPARDPARRRLRHQPRALRRHHRGPRLPGPRPREEPGHLRGLAGAAARTRRLRSRSWSAPGRAWRATARTSCPLRTPPARRFATTTSAS